jgi:tRNA threonylcarbamoyladenosine biosynthesis protein TsaB
MKILAIDTSTDACSAALWQAGEITERYEVAPQQHGQLILLMIESLLADAELNLSQLDALAFGRGPGSFTGLRIAAGVVQGLAVAHDLPVLAVSTLLALAQAAYNEYQVSHVCSAIDARMHEIYWAAYSVEEGKIQALTNEIVCSADAVHVPVAKAWYGVGSAWSVYADVLQKNVGEHFAKVLPIYFPRAREIATLAHLDYQQGNLLRPEQALPVYLRDTVVRGSSDG